MIRFKMKYQYIIMLSTILSLFGCRKTPAVSVSSKAIGPFTIETITEKGKTWNANYGRANYTNVSYDVKYKGETLHFGDSLETNTGLPGIWRVFLLTDSPQPAMILGSQSMFLVTLKDEKPVITSLFSQGSDFASIQWLDSEEGQPGMYREIYSSDTQETSVELSGGRYLAISHAVVLDTKTFEIFPFNTNNETVDSFYVHLRRALAFSPDSNQVVYGAYKSNEEDYSITYLALACYDFRTGKSYAVPFDKKSMNVYTDTKLDNDWFNDYFEWTKADSGGLQLQVKKSGKAPYKKGLIYFERYPGYQYELYPVKATLMNPLYAYVQQVWKIDTAQVTQVHEEYNNKITIPYQNRTFIIEYGKYGDELVLYEDRGNTTFEENKLMIQQIAKGFNKLLGEGKYQQEFKVVEQ